MGWSNTNSSGQITGYSGINFGVGYTQLSYLEPLKLNAWNTYWQWGTIYIDPKFTQVGGSRAADSRHLGHFRHAFIYILLTRNADRGSSLEL